MSQWKVITDGGMGMREPPLYRYVLVALSESQDGTRPPSIIVGYRNSHGLFITPGGIGAKPLWYMDCFYTDFLPDGVKHPQWVGKKR